MFRRSLFISPFGCYFIKFFLSVFFSLIVLLSQATLARPVPHSFADLAEQIKGAVVNITVNTKGQSFSDLPPPILPEGSPFQDFFGDFFGQTPRSQAQTAIGSGFVVSSDGYIVTNEHVIKNADEIKIELFSGETLNATLIGSDSNTDIALLKVTPNKPLEFVGFGDSDAARVGDWVMAVGNPLGQGFSVSVGIISARNRELSGAYDDFIQTDAAINQGNSGGPLFNLEGQVIGVNTAILSPNGGSIGIGFSMSSAVVTHVIQQLKNYGETRRGWLGVQIQDLSPELASSWGINAENGVVVSAVLDGPARGAGINVGDVIVQFNRKDILDARNFVRMVGESKANQTIELVFFRKGIRQSLSVTLTRREENEGQEMKQEKPKASPELIRGLGLSLTPLTDEIRQAIGFDSDEPGLLVREVKQGSISENAGLQPGTILLSANNNLLYSIDDLIQIIDTARAANRNNIALLIQEQAGRVFIAIPLPE